jgi:hypothetical protein
MRQHRRIRPHYQHAPVLWAAAVSILMIALAFLATWYFQP